MTVRKQMKGNALHFCNCHGTACNKDWTSAGGEDQPTQSPPDNTIKWKIYLLIRFLEEEKKTGHGQVLCDIVAWFTSQCTSIRNIKAKESFTNQVLLLRLEGEQVFRVRVWLKDRLSRQHRVQNCQEERPWRPDVCQRLRHWGRLLLWHLW